MDACFCCSVDEREKCDQRNPGWNKKKYIVGGGEVGSCCHLLYFTAAGCAASWGTGGAKKKRQNWNSGALKSQNVRYADTLLGVLLLLLLSALRVHCYLFCRCCVSSTYSVFCILSYYRVVLLLRLLLLVSSYTRTALVLSSTGNVVPGMPQAILLDTEPVRFRNGELGDEKSFRRNRKTLDLFNVKVH